MRGKPNGPNERLNTGCNDNDLGAKNQRERNSLSRENKKFQIFPCSAGMLRDFELDFGVYVMVNVCWYLLATFFFFFFFELFPRSFTVLVV